MKDVSFEGSGCAISKASASMMTQAVKGKTKVEAEALFNEFHRMAMGELDEETEPNQLGKLKIFPASVIIRPALSARRFPGTRCTRRWKARTPRQPNRNAIRLCRPMCGRPSAFREEAESGYARTSGQSPNLDETGRAQALPHISRQRSCPNSPSLCGIADNPYKVSAA